MQGRSLFISSCSRRQLARRRPARSAARLQMIVAVVALVLVAGLIVALRVGI